jgi:hypothetical protein
MSELYAKVPVQQWPSANHLIVFVGLQQLGAHLAYPKAFDSDRAVAVAISELLPISVRSVQTVLKAMRADGSYTIDSSRRVRLRVQEVHTSVQEVHTSVQEVHTSVQEVHTSVQEVHTDRVVGVQEVHTLPAVTCGDALRKVESAEGLTNHRETTDVLGTTTEVAAVADPSVISRGTNRYAGSCLYCSTHVKVGEGGRTKDTSGKTHAICGDRAACDTRVNDKRLLDEERARIERERQEEQRRAQEAWRLAHPVDPERVTAMLPPLS